MIAEFAAAVAAYHARDRVELSKVDRAVARILAGEAPLDVADDLELQGEEFREATLRVHAMKPKPKKARERKAVRRCLY